MRSMYTGSRYVNTEKCHEDAYKLSATQEVMVHGHLYTEKCNYPRDNKCKLYPNREKQTNKEKES